jgi:hypothetical protein
LSAITHCLSPAGAAQATTLCTTIPINLGALLRAIHTIANAIDAESVAGAPKAFTRQLCFPPSSYRPAETGINDLTSVASTTLAVCNV